MGTWTLVILSFNIFYWALSVCLDLYKYRSQLGLYSNGLFDSIFLVYKEPVPLWTFFFFWLLICLWCNHKSFPLPWSIALLILICHFLNVFANHLILIRILYGTDSDLISRVTLLNSMKLYTAKLSSGLSPTCLDTSKDGHAQKKILGFPSVISRNSKFNAIIFKGLLWLLSLIQHFPLVRGEAVP